MSKEELEKEAGDKGVKYADSLKMDIKVEEGVSCYAWYQVEQAYEKGALDFAEPREKQIEIDAEQIRALQKTNGALTDKVRGLEAQIEKMKIKWHDLEKDPNDLPKDYKTMCICLSDFGSKYEPVPQVCVGYCDSLGWSDYMGSSLYSTVRYWCELPQF